MTDNDFRQIKEVMREENDSLMNRIQDWTKEYMVSKEGYLKDQLH